MFIIFDKQYKGRVLENHLSHWQSLPNCCIFQAVDLDEALIAEPGVVDQRIVWTFAEDYIAEGFGKVVDVGVAEISKIVEGRVAEESCLTPPFWLEGDARYNVDCCCFISEDDDSGEGVVHIAGDFGYDLGCALFLAFYFHVGQCPSREDNVIEGFLLFREFESGLIVRLAGAPLVMRDVVDEQNSLLGHLPLEFPQAGPIVLARRVGDKKHSSLRVVNLEVVNLDNFLEGLLCLLEGEHGGVVGEVDVELCLIGIANVHVLIVGEGGAGGIEVFEFFLEGHQVDACQFVHEAGGNDLYFWAFSEQEGQQQYFLVLSKKHVVGILEEGQVGAQPLHLQSHLGLSQLRLVRPREGLQLMEGGGVDEGKAETLEGEGVELSALRQLQRVQLYHIIQTAMAF